MALARIRIVALVMVLVAGAIAFASPAWCLEMKLAGASLGDTPEEILASPNYGPPDGVYAPGNIFNSVKAQPGELPPWALAVRMEQISPGQVEWVYNRDPASVGIVLTGEGINAHVTDIIVSLWRTFDASSRMAQTSKGARIGSTFSDVLERYGWPNRLQIIAEAGQTQATPRPALGGPATATGAGPRTFRPGGLRIAMGGRRTGGGGGLAPSSPGPAGPAPGGFAFGGLGGGGRRLSGLGPLPSVGLGAAVPALPGASAAAGGPITSFTADVGQTPSVTFTKSCVASYPSVDFLIYRMKVFRIHVYGR